MILRREEEALRAGRAGTPTVSLEAAVDEDGVSPPDEKILRGKIAPRRRTGTPSEV